MRIFLLPSLLFSTLLSAQAVFTQSGTFVVPAGVDTITVELIGAGGNGGFNGSGGGGGGGYARRTYVVTPGTSYSVVVGTGGSGLATIIGGLGMLAGAGENGTSVANPNIGGGGAGGAGIGGQVNYTGGMGGGGYYTYFGGGGGGAAGPGGNGGVGGNTITWTGNCLTPGGSGGLGSGAPAGDGGKGAGFTDQNCSVTDPEGNGGSYGGGGGGGNGIGSPGGVGGGGLCTISWSAPSGVMEQLVAVPVLAINPITDRIVLRNTVGNEGYELLDPNGRIIWKGTDIGSQDFAQLSAGPYTLRVQRDAAVSTLKLLKQ